MRPRKKPLSPPILRMSEVTIFKWLQIDILNRSHCVCRINFRPLLTAGITFLTCMSITELSNPPGLKPQQNFNDLFGFYSPKYYIYFMTGHTLSIPSLFCLDTYSEESRYTSKCWFFSNSLSLCVILNKLSNSVPTLTDISNWTHKCITSIRVCWMSSVGGKPQFHL